MTRTEQCELAARLAKILGLEFPEKEAGWRHRDSDKSMRVRCRVTDDGVELDLDVSPIVAERLLRVIASVPWQQT